ncbi:hypothetical protein WJX72_005293 [[Myrmecia] bisecta]|uniref:fructokinase n=1 Tax=[Myrmecia] bisecta TaxID=41462 RepID=A0AAW1Q8X3_9CHLO
MVNEKDRGDGNRERTDLVFGCFGEALFDCLAVEKGVPKEEVKNWTPYPGGAPANVAAALGKLGVKVVFVSAMGLDDLGDQMLILLEGRNVDLSAVQRVKQPTRDVLVTRSLEGDRTFSGFGVAKTTEYADCFLDSDKLPIDVIQNATALVTGTLGLAYPVTAAAMNRAVETAKSGPCQVLIDVNWRPVFWADNQDANTLIAEYCRKADILKLSEEEAEWLYGVPADIALEQPEQVYAKLAPSGCAGVLVTAGGRGSAYCFQGAGGKLELTGFVPVLDVEVVDTTGAGDAFLAGFLFAMVQAGGLTALQADADKLRRAVEFASACGGFTTTSPGAIGAQPSQEEADKLLAARKSVPA